MLLASQYQLVKVKDENGRTALHYASENEDIHSCGPLVERGAIVNVQDQNVNFFINVKDNGVRTSLQGALEKGNTRVYELLLGRGSLLMARDNRGMTALHHVFES